MKFNYLFYILGLAIGFIMGIAFCELQEISKTLTEMKESLKRWR